MDKGDKASKISVMKPLGFTRKRMLEALAAPKKPPLIDVVDEAFEKFKESMSGLSTEKIIEAYGELLSSPSNNNRGTLQKHKEITEVVLMGRFESILKSGENLTKEQFDMYTDLQ
ncbi:hypothetical protein A9Q91_05225 [Candidatus Gracilibacteria bacterium 28_42_T64]|nr:hypothetical protein A9Q91_05225 [Candidatus Gracilibacteria bacterium 28_42_T64]